MKHHSGIQFPTSKINVKDAGGTKRVLNQYTDIQPENSRASCKKILTEYDRNCLLYQIVTDDEKYIHFKNSKSKILCL